MKRPPSFEIGKAGPVASNCGRKGAPRSYNVNHLLEVATVERKQPMARVLNSYTLCIISNDLSNFGSCATKKLARLMTLRLNFVSVGETVGTMI